MTPKTIQMLFICCASAAIARAPEQITRLREIDSETVLVAGGAAEVWIVYPGPPSDEKEQAYWDDADPGGDTEAYAALAREIAAAIEAAGGARPALRRADEYTPADREQHLILLGRMNNNRPAYELYVDRRIAADDWFPGPDGFVVRTVTDPWGLGRNVILLGGSDIAGVRRAVAHFLALPELTGRSATVAIPRQWTIRFQGMDEHIEAFAATIMPHYREVFFDRSYYHGMENQVVSAATGYFVTGRPEYAEAFERMMRRSMPGVMEKYPASQVGPLYAAIEDSPHFTDEFRIEMVNWLYTNFLQWCRHGHFRNWGEGELRDLAAWNMLRVPTSRGWYFRRYYPDLDLSRYDRVLEDAGNALDAISRDSNLFNEMGGYTRYGPAIMMELCRRYGKTDFFESGHADKFMDFLIRMTDNRGRRGQFSGLGRPGIQDGWLYPVLYSLDPRHAWVVGDPDSLAGALEPEITAGNLRSRPWTYIPRLRPQTPDFMTEIQVTGISEVAYEAAKMENVRLNFFRPGGYDGRVPRERTYRILAMRSGFDFESDQYMRMYGTGRYGGAAQNRIPVLQHGQSGASDSFSIRRNGEAASFDLFSDLRVNSYRGGTGLVRSLAFSGEADWSRDIVWRSGAGWLMIDRILIHHDGDYRLTSDWSGGGLEITRAAGDPDFSGLLRAGDEYVSATLVSGSDEMTVRRVTDDIYVLEESGKVATAGSGRVSGGSGALSFPGGVSLRSDLFYMSPSELYFGGFSRFDSPGLSLESSVPVNLRLDVSGGVLYLDSSEPVRLTFAGMRVGGSSSLDADAGEHEFEAALDEGVKDSVSALVASLREMPETPVAHEPTEIEYPLSLAERWRYETGVVPQVIESADLDGDGR